MQLTERIDKNHPRNSEEMRRVEGYLILFRNPPNWGRPNDEELKPVELKKRSKPFVEDVDERKEHSTMDGYKNNTHVFCSKCILVVNLCLLKRSIWF